MEKTEPKNSNWRWRVLVTLFLATFINYFDRQTLGTALDPISEEFGLTNIQRGNLLAAFTLTYALMHIFIGLLIDRIRNIRLFFAVMVIGWSLTTFFTGFATDYNSLLWLRYLLGIWEAVNFPICLMIIARIFPAKERTLASGIFASGAFLATLAAPPVVIFFSNAINWRYSFFSAGLLGFFWLIPWLLIFRRPAQRSPEWAQADKNNALTLQQNAQQYLRSYQTVLRAPGFWGVALMGLGIIPALYFATQWFPTFFTQGLHHPYDQQLSTKLMLIYFMQDVGLWVGGTIVFWLAGRGFTVLNARKMVITGAFVLMLSILLVPYLQSISASVVLLAIYVFGIGAFLGNQHAFKQDVVKDQVGTVSALVGFVEMSFTFLVLRQIGIITNETSDFTPVFFLLAGLSFFALLVVYVFMRPKWIKID